jgi:hypothetical protein
MAYAQCAVVVQTREGRNGFPGDVVAAEPCNEATEACCCSRKNHQAQRRTWVVVDRKEGGVNRSDGRNFFSGNRVLKESRDNRSQKAGHVGVPTFVGKA